MGAEDPKGLTYKERGFNIRRTLSDVLPGTVKVGVPFKPAKLAEELVGVTGFTQDVIETAIINATHLVLKATPEQLKQVDTSEDGRKGWYCLREDFDENFAPGRNEPTKDRRGKGRGKVAPGRRGRTPRD